MNVSPQPSYASSPPMQAPAYAPPPQPYYPPAAPDPYRPLPPRNVGAKLGIKDDIVTGSISKKPPLREKTLMKKPAPHVAQQPAAPARTAAKPAPKAAVMSSGDLFSPVPMAKQNGAPNSAAIGEAALKALREN